MNSFGDGGGIPQFDKSGKALSQQEREKIAHRLGKCIRCGVKTHQVSVMRRQPQTNDAVFKGTCIKCNPTKVPAEVLAQYERSNPRITTTVVVAGSDPPPIRQGRPAAQRTRTNNAQPGRRAAPDLVRNATAPNRVNTTSGGRQTPGMVRSATGGDRQAPGMVRSATGGGSRAVPRRRPGAPAGGPSKPGYGNRPGPRGKPLGPTFDGDSSFSSMSESLHSNASEVRAPRVVINEDNSASKLTEAHYADLCKAVLDALQEANTDQIKQALHGIRNTGNISDPREAVDAIREVMFRYVEEPRVIAVSCGALLRIVVDHEDLKVEVVENGILDSVFDALRKDVNDPDFVNWSLGLVACLGTNPQNKELIVRHSGIDLILDVLKRNAGSAGVLEWAARALHSLIYWHGGDGVEDYQHVFQRNIASIEEADGVDIFINVMKNHVSETVAQSWSLKLLWRLQACDDDSVTEKMFMAMRDGNMLETCVKMLRRATPEVFQMSLELMCGILGVSEGNKSYFTAAADASSQTVRTMADRADDEETQSSCCRFFATLAMGTEDSRSAVVSARGINSVADALQKFPSSPSIVESSAYLLWCVSYEGGLDSGIAFEMAKTIKQAYQADSASNTHLLLPICGFSSNLVMAEGAKSSNIMITEIVGALQAEDPQVLKQAERAIVNFCITFPDEAEFVIETMNTSRFVEMMHSPAGLSLSICSMLSSLALQCDGVRPSLMSPSMVSGILENLNKTDSSELKEALMNLLATLALPGKRSLILPPDMFGIILDVVHAHRNDIRIQLGACGLIRNALLASSAAPALEGVMSSMVDLLTSPETAVSVQTEACSVLWALTFKYGSKHDGNELLTMYRTLIGMITQYREGTVEFNFDLFNSALGALACVTSCMRTIPARLVSPDVDELVSVPYVALEYEAERVEPYVRLLDAVYSLTWIDDDMVVQCGSIVVVIDTMAEFEGCAEIQELGSAILGLLAAKENLEVTLSIVQTDGVDMVINAIAVHPNNKSVTVVAMKALAHLSIDAEARMLMTSLGGLMIMADGMRKFIDDLDLVKAAMSALLSLSADSDLGLLGEARIVHVAVEGMNKYPDNAQIQEFGMGILQNMSMRLFEAKQTIAEAGGIEAVSNAIREFMGTPSILERAFTTLWSLAVLDNNQILIANADGINLVINGMMTALSYETVQKQGCGCLCTLSTDSENKSIIQNVGGVDSIVFAMWTHYGSEDIQIEACRALSSLAVDAVSNEVMIAGESEIAAILSAMRRFPGSEKLQEHGCVALRNFLLSVDNVDFMRSMTEEITQLVADAAGLFPMTCSERAGQVLASLV